MKRYVRLFEELEQTQHKRLLGVWLYADEKFLNGSASNGSGKTELRIYVFELGERDAAQRKAEELIMMGPYYKWTFDRLVTRELEEMGISYPDVRGMKPERRLETLGKQRLEGIKRSALSLAHAQPQDRPPYPMQDMRWDVEYDETTLGRLMEHLNRLIEYGANMNRIKEIFGGKLDWVPKEAMAKLRRQEKSSGLFGV
jgi:hypothetical protein